MKFTEAELKEIEGVKKRLGDIRQMFDELFDSQIKRQKLSTERMEREIEEIKAKVPKHNPENTTVIRGGYPWETCYRYACYLAKYIYSLPNNPNFYTEYPEKMAEVEEHWQQWDFLSHDSGLMAALFKQNGYDAQSEKALCPPTLVFRGTDFDDFRGLAALVKIRVSWRTFWWTFPYPWIGESGIYVKGWDREDFIKAGYTEHSLYEEEGVMPALFAKPFGFDIDVDINTNIEFYIYTKGGFGDWNNNITQGIGKGSIQYEQAIQFGRDIVDEKIISAADKRLEVTGHSLGGGLAAATCCVLTAEYNDITVDSIIFNAAGVHKNTITKELKSDERAGGAMSFASCLDICVEDEILTTLAVHYNKLPILGSIFTYVARHIGQYGLPNPSDIATIRDIPAYSPGTIKQKEVQAQALEKLPARIQPILAADTAEAEQERLAALNLSRNAPVHVDYGYYLHKRVDDLKSRIQRNKELVQQIEKGEHESAIKTIKAILEAEAPRQKRELEEELKHAKSVLASATSKITPPAKGERLKKLFPIAKQNAVPWPREDGFPLITMMDNFLQNSFDITTFISQLLAFLNRRYGEEARRGWGTPLGTYEEMFKNFLEDLEPELAALEVLMGLSSEYHGMDIVIASYESMLQERALNPEPGK